VTEYFFARLCIFSNGARSRWNFVFACPMLCISCFLLIASFMSVSDYPIIQF